jgi:hypothetical protein
VITIEQAAEALPALNGSAAKCSSGIRANDRIANPLMIPLGVIMSDELPNRPAQPYGDVDLQAEFNRDVRQAAATALETTKPGVGLNPLDQANPWAVFDNYIDRVAGQWVNSPTPKRRRTPCTCPHTFLSRGACGMTS